MNLSFVITNDQHHQAMMWPVARQLAARHRVHCLSFAEFRGLDTPMQAWRDMGASVTRVPPLHIRPRPQTADMLVSISSGGTGSRRGLHALVWHGLLRHGVNLKWPDLVILPNDTAYPSNYLVAALKRRGIPFVLMQEGIRFPLPGEGATAYGTQGAAAVACWGAADADYFAARGVARATLHITGNPRYDAILARDACAAAASLKQSGELPHRYLLFASNPIDDQAFCSTEIKYASFRHFAERVLPLVQAQGLQLALKLHGRESEAGYRAALGPLAEQLVFPRVADIHTVLAGAEAVVVWASTVGLEGLLQGTALAVLETPGHGHVFDYVSGGAAVPLWADQALEAPLRSLLNRDAAARQRAEAYVESHLACRGRSTAAIVGLIENTLARHAV